MSNAKPGRRPSGRGPGSLPQPTRPWHLQVALTEGDPQPSAPTARRTRHAGRGSAARRARRRVTRAGSTRRRVGSSCPPGRAQPRCTSRTHVRSFAVISIHTTTRCVVRGPVEMPHNNRCNDIRSQTGTGTGCSSSGISPSRSPASSSDPAPRPGCAATGTRCGGGARTGAHPSERR